MKIDVAIPCVHLNGDRAEVLIDRLEKAWYAVEGAKYVMRECAPNGRDAYPVDGLMQRLEAQHRQRQECLQAVLDSLAAEIQGIQEAVK